MTMVMQCLAWFCGLGGSSEGARRAGLTVTAGVDNDAWALASHAINSDALTIDFDLSELSVLNDRTIRLARDLMRNCGVAEPEGFDGIHLYTSGCPGFSKGGQMDPADSRNRLVFSMLPILAASPRSRLLFENVPAFLSEKFADIHEELFMSLEELRGHRLDRQFLRHYILHGTHFGLAQKRSRLIFPVMRAGEPYPLPPLRRTIWPRTAGDVIGDGFVPYDNRHPPLTRLEERLVRNVRPGEAFRDAYPRDWFLREYAEERGWSGRRRRIASMDGQLPTIVASMPGSMSRVDELHPHQRHFAIDERQEAQGLRGMTVLGPCEVACRLIGNAVPPQMCEAAIMAYFFNPRYAEPKALVRPRMASNPAGPASDCAQAGNVERIETVPAVLAADRAVPATLIPGDCISAMRQMEPGSVDFVFTDPPYGHRTNDGTDLISRREAALGRGAPRPPRPILNDGPEADALFRGFVLEATRLLRPGGVLCCCAGGGGPDPQAARWTLWLGELKFDQCVIWDKRMGMGWRYRRSYETVLVAYKPGAKMRWYDTSHRIENVIRHIPKIIPSARQHPTEKPVALAEHFIRLHTQPGDIVLDPFLGSGSTGVAAVRLGRKFVGIELDPHWFHVAETRLRDVARENHYRGAAFAAQHKQLEIGDENECRNE